MNTKKVLRGVALGAVCCSMALSITGCRGGERDPEDNPVTLAIGALDGNYNPFFYTAQNDGEVTSLTQIPLVTADIDANIICGQNEATVALAYRELDADGNVISASDDDKAAMQYQYVIKKGIKFSDGVDLTIKDVLFNFYVYLDPYYTGSSTLYATKIKGLSQYRTQRADSDDDGTGDFQGAARQRFDNLIEWDKPNTNQQETEQLLKDAITVATKYKEELETAWSNAEGTAASYREVTYDSNGKPEPSFSFTEDWEVFYYTTNFTNHQYKYNNKNKRVRKIINNKYVMSFDEGGDDHKLRQDMEAELEGLSGDARKKAMKELAIDTVFSESIFATYDKDGKITSAEPAVTGSLAAVLESTGAGSEALRQFLNDEMSDHYNTIREEGKLAYNSISGIKVDKVSASDFNGSMTAGSPLDPNKGEYDRVTIVMDEVDPVAKYNFGIVIAPMHYYSGTSGDVDYVQRAMDTDPNNDNVADRFGVKFADGDFFDNVLKVDSINKSSKPVGAGPYKMRDDRLEINRDCRYVRNEHFETVGDGIENAKIKYLNYRYISDDQIVTSLISGDIDFGTPQCTPRNIEMLNGSRNFLSSNQYDANGFGYVGVNPKAVPDITVRRAIMKAMNVADITKTYYTEDYASVIYRPITTNSWVYKKADKNLYFSEVDELAYTRNHSEITDMLEDAGYDFKNGVYEKDGKKLKYTFTIAGETQDHPAFTMFKDAANFLNECGFDITVLTDINALQKLATGSLQVWAAAWTSGIDPDMYQVYHKDSKASSVRNWGYDIIYASPDKYTTEVEIIDEMSGLIERGRSLTSQDARTPIYCEAMDLLMELAVELPTYQRKDMYVYNKNVIDGKSLNSSPNAQEGPLNRIWELNYV